MTHPKLTVATTNHRSFFKERPLQKVLRKLREEPLVPLGAALTCLAFYRAWRGIRTGNQVQVQRAFRARVAAQAFTVVAMVAGGLYYSEDRRKSKEARALAKQRDEEDKKARWLRELEARDVEDKEIRDEVERRRAGRSGGGRIASEMDKLKKEVRELEAEVGDDVKKSSWGSWLGFDGGKKQPPPPPSDEKKQ